MANHDSHPRVAFFTDSFHETNGVGLTSRQFHEFARRTGRPFFSAHAGPETRLVTEGALTTLELQRGPAAFYLDADLQFDPFFLRHRRRVREALARFEPDLVHVTGPGDIGILGAIAAADLGVPMAASWHTNVHEFGARRLDQLFRWLPARIRSRLVRAAERNILTLAMLIYRRALALYAPSPELAALVGERTGRPVNIMRRGVDTRLFSPEKRRRTDDAVLIGFVSRLEPEKNARFLQEIEDALVAAGETGYRFLVAGQGSEQEWLRRHLRRAEHHGRLAGEELARAYADLDIFVFPSRTDTFGNVVQEALASGVPAVVTDGGGPKYIVEHGVTGFVASGDREFTGAVVTLVRDPELRRRMGQAGRAYACAQSWDSVFEKVYAGYAACFPNPAEAKAPWPADPRPKPL